MWAVVIAIVVLICLICLGARPTSRLFVLIIVLGLVFVFLLTALRLPGRNFIVLAFRLFAAAFTVFELLVVILVLVQFLVLFLRAARHDFFEVVVVVELQDVGQGIGSNEIEDFVGGLRVVGNGRRLAVERPGGISRVLDVLPKLRPFEGQVITLVGMVDVKGATRLFRFGTRQGHDVAVCLRRLFPNDGRVLGVAAPVENPIDEILLRPQSLRLVHFLGVLRLLCHFANRAFG